MDDLSIWDSEFAHSGISDFICTGISYHRKTYWFFLFSLVILILTSVNVLFLFSVKMLQLDTPLQHHGIYSPLNQAMTDSDSDEEIHNSSKHRHFQMLQQQSLELNNRRVRSPPTSLPLNQSNPGQYKQKERQQRQKQLLMQQNHSENYNELGRLIIWWIKIN